MRKPRDLDRFATAEATALWLEGLAANTRRHAEQYPLVKIKLTVTVWNPAWEQSKPIAKSPGKAS